MNQPLRVFLSNYYLYLWNQGYFRQDSFDTTLELVKMSGGLLNRNRCKMSYTKNKGSIAYEMSKVQSG